MNYDTVEPNYILHQSIDQDSSEKVSFNVNTTESRGFKYDLHQGGSSALAAIRHAENKMMLSNINGSQSQKVCQSSPKKAHRRYIVSAEADDDFVLLDHEAEDILSRNKDDDDKQQDS